MRNLKKFHPKQPAEVLPYYVELEDLEPGDSISSVSTDADSGISVDDTTHTDFVATIWISGGTDGETYRVTATLTTANGQVLEAELDIPVKEV